MFGNVRLSRLGRWLVLTWTVAISLRYFSTALKSFRFPFTPGQDFEWIIVWFALAFAAFLSAGLGLRVVGRVWAVVISGIALAILVLSHVWIAAILAVWLIIAAVLVGGSVLKALGLSAPDDLDEQITIALPLGVAAFALLVLVIGLLQLLTPALVWALLVGITLLELKNAPALLGRMRIGLAGLVPSGLDFESGALLPLCGCVFLANLMWAVAPELHYDSLNYHLAVPQIYLEKGRVLDLPYFWHSYFAHLAEMFFAFCMALHSEILAKLMNTSIGVAAAVGVYSLGKLVFTQRVGLWAAAFFYTTPLTMWLSGSAYTDLIVALFVVAQVIAFLRWHRTRQTAWICVTGILIGSAVAVKLDALYAAVGVGLALVGLLLASPAPFRKRAGIVAVCLISAALLALPWYLIVYIHTGNPVFPLLNGVFKSPKASMDNTLMNAATFGVGTTWAALIRLPFRLTFDTTRFGEGLIRGALGPLMLFLIPFGLLLIFRGNPETRILWLVAGTFLCLWAYSFQYGRYYIAMMPVIAVLAIAGVDLVSQTVLTKRVNRAALAILLVLQVSLTPLLFWNIRERFPLRLALGLESRESFLNRSLYGYAAAIHINKVFTPGQKVLGVGTENLRFYLKVPLESLPESLINSSARRAFELPAGRELAQSLSDLGFSYIFVSVPEQLPYTSSEFLRKFATVDYADTEAVVYRLNALVKSE